MGRVKRRTSQIIADMGGDPTEAQRLLALSIATTAALKEPLDKQIPVTQAESSYDSFG